MPFHNGRHGINCYGAAGTGADGTSCQFAACFPGGNWAAGYHLFQMAYSNLDACAADANGIAYYYDTCLAITESGCGQEEALNYQLLGKTTFTPNGLSRYISNSKMVMNTPFMINNVGTACHIANGSTVTINNIYAEGQSRQLPKTPTPTRPTPSWSTPGAP